MINYFRTCEGGAPGNLDKLFIIPINELGNITITDEQVSDIEITSGIGWSVVEVDRDTFNLTDTTVGKTRGTSTTEISVRISTKTRSSQKLIDQIRQSVVCGLAVIRIDSTGRVWLTGAGPDIKWSRPFDEIEATFNSGTSIEDTEEGNAWNLILRRRSVDREWELDETLSARVLDGTANFINWTGNGAEVSFFNIEIDTTQDGKIGSDSVALPIQGTDMNIDWGDGTVETVTQTDTPDDTNWISHTYDSPGNYDIKINNLDRILYKDQQADYEKIVAIKQWGTSEWKTMNNAFFGTENLTTYTATDIPNFSQCTDLSYMFTSSAFNGDIGNWDVSNITSMTKMFQYTNNFNQDLSNWDVSNVKNSEDMEGMFYVASEFNADLSDWCVPTIPTKPSGFDLYADNWVLPKPIWGTCGGV